MARFSSAPGADFTLQPPDGGSVKVEEKLMMEAEAIPVDLAKKLFEIEAQKNWVNEENQRLTARNLELEQVSREQRRLLEDKDEVIIRLKENAMSMSGTEGRSKEKYDRLHEKYQKLREDYELSERKWRAEKKNIEEERWKLDLEKSKLEIDLEAVRKGMYGNGELYEKMKAIEELKRTLEDKDVLIRELVIKNEVLSKEMIDISEQWDDRVFKLEEVVQNLIPTREATDLKVSGPKSVGISLLEPKKENLQTNDQLKEPSIKKAVPDAPKSTYSQIVQISDDEDEEEEEKSLPVASISAAKCPENLQKRKSEAVTCSTEKQAETKRLKYDPKDGKLWETAERMFAAFNTNKELCMKSVCVLYRKHNSLGVWKNYSDGNRSGVPLLNTKDVSLGKFLTNGDPEGMMKRSVAEIERQNPSVLEECRDIARHHYKGLFQIYSNNMDPYYFS